MSQHTRADCVGAYCYKGHW